MSEHSLIVLGSVMVVKQDGADRGHQDRVQGGDSTDVYGEKHNLAFGGDRHRGTAALLNPG